MRAVAKMLLTLGLRRRAEAMLQGECLVPTGSDDLALAFQQLCRRMNRSCSAAQIRAVIQAGPHGATAAGLLDSARQLGLEAAELQADETLLAKLEPPFLIIGDRPGDGCLVVSRRRDHLELVAPRTGQRSFCAIETVADMAAGVLAIEPREAAADSGGWRVPMTQRLRPILLEIALASAVINLLALAMPVMLMTLYDQVIRLGSFENLNGITLGIATLIGCEWLLGTLRRYIASHASGRFDAALGADVMSHLIHLPLQRFERAPNGPALERLRRLDELKAFLAGPTPLLLVDLAFVGPFLAALLFLDWRLGLITLAAMPLFALLPVLVERRRRTLAAAMQAAQAGRLGAFEETVRQVLTVKTLGLEHDMTARFKSKLAAAAEAEVQAGDLAGMTTGAGQVLQHLMILAVIYVGAGAILAGDLSVGALLAAAMLALRALTPPHGMIDGWHQLQAARRALAGLDRLMRAPTERDSKKEPYRCVDGRLRVEAVSYRYAPHLPPALDEVDLAAEPGEVLGIAGPPGAGKSTLLKLLLGLDHPNEGRILIDELDARLWPATMLRRQIGVVPQKIELFSGTIADNIALGAAERSRDRIIAAAKLAGAHDFIRRLPDAYDTMLVEQGVTLAADERLMIALARALIREPRVLILDEASERLDTAAEHALLVKLKRASAARTLILLSRRLEALAIADRVIVLADGRIRETGPMRTLAGRLQRFGQRQPHLAPV